MQENILSEKIIGCCIRVHRILGPGLLESVYEEALAHELNNMNINFERQEEMAVNYGDIRLNLGFRADIIVEDKVLLELKSVEKLISLHFKQVLTYLRLTNLKLGLLINFNVELMKDGIRRIVNDL